MKLPRGEAAAPTARILLLLIIHHFSLYDFHPGMELKSSYVHRPRYLDFIVVFTFLLYKKYRAGSRMQNATMHTVAEIMRVAEFSYERSSSLLVPNVACR